VHTFRFSIGVLALSGAAFVAGTFQPAHASCGASFCSVNTQWETQGAWTGEGLRLGLRYEVTDQDQLRSGADKVAPAGELGEHDETRTINRNLQLSADYAFSPRWALSVQVPIVQRDHEHVHNDIPPETERWRFTTLGDARVSGRWQTTLGQHSSGGVQFGLKLPTGRFNEANDDGERAERSLQPGTGTTDLLLGVYSHHRLEGDATTLFLQALWQRPLGERAGYQPGQQLSFDAGVRYAFTPNFHGLLQLNLQWKDHDEGVNAEPQESGSTAVFVSPGVSVNITPHLQAYGFVQLPLYQYMQGTQLTADWSAVAGLSLKL
jgi:hypothetical protein